MHATLPPLISCSPARWSESATLIFYGEDAEALYDTLMPVLGDYLLAEGARFSIRQGSQLSELTLPSRGT